MSTNEQLPAEEQLGRSPAYPWGDTIAGICGGLTKRELFAAMAMQAGISANAPFKNFGELAQMSTAAADALLKELAKGPTS